MLRLCYIYFEIGYTIERETKGGGAMNVRTFTAVIYKEDDLYVAECPEVGTASQGYTIEEAIAILRKQLSYTWKIFLCLMLVGHW